MILPGALDRRCEAVIWKGDGEYDGKRDQRAASEVSATVRTGKTVDVTLHITAKDLWMFSMYHANAGFMGMFNLIFFPGGSVSSDLSLEYHYGAIQVPACGLCADLYGVAAFSSLAQGQKTGKASGGEKTHAPDV